MSQPEPCTPRNPRASTECRCLCGSLVARLTRRGVELKCRRCKRILLVPWHDPGAPPSLDPEASGPRGPEPSLGAAP
jgi:hypothetical protein